MKDVSTYILIPTYNCVNRIDSTITSIYKQDYDMAKIKVICVDFGSEDGTYEKLLEYEKYNLGIYKINKCVKREYRMSEIANILPYIGIEEECYFLGLNPGDILDSNFIRYCRDVFDNCEDKRVRTILAEGDLWDGEKIIKQKPLYNNSFILESENKIEYLKRGYNHKVFVFTKDKFNNHLQYSAALINETHDWNVKFLQNYSIKSIYVPRIMGVIAENENDNELDRIVMNYAAMLGYIRTYENAGDNSLSKSEQKIVMKNYAFNALWRSSHIIENEKVNIKSAEDCFMFSEVIYPEITETAAYKYMEKYFRGEKTYSHKEFERLLPDETTDSPPENSYIFKI